MGMFSWLTADTKESISHIYSGRETATVYLLQPDGQSPIKETAYEGYGEFGGVDAYAWLARMNSDGQSSDRDFGTFLSCGSVYTDGDTYYVCTMLADAVQVRMALRDDTANVVEFADYAVLLKDEMTADELITQKIWKTKRFKLAYPLKFSFDPTAKYEDCKPSRSCRHQGM
jgi:hypothetical protein